MYDFGLNAPSFEVFEGCRKAIELLVGKLVLGGVLYVGKVGIRTLYFYICVGQDLDGAFEVVVVHALAIGAGFDFKVDYGFARCLRHEPGGTQGGDAEAQTARDCVF